MLRRLPRLRDDSVTPEQAFGGTFHINETFSQLDTAYTRAEHGVVPDPLPCEIYCHSLADPSILSDRLRESGAHTLTVFGLHTPHSLIAGADPGQDARHADVCGAELAEFGSCRTDSGRADGGFGGPVVHRGQDHAGPGTHAGHDGRQHFPRRACHGRSPRTTSRWTLRRGGGVWPRRTIGSCCAARGLAAVARCRESAATTPRWRCWRARPSRRQKLCEPRSTAPTRCHCFRGWHEMTD